MDRRRVGLSRFVLITVDLMIQPQLFMLSILWIHSSLIEASNFVRSLSIHGAYNQSRFATTVRNSRAIQRIVRGSIEKQNRNTCLCEYVILCSYILAHMNTHGLRSSRAKINIVGLLVTSNSYWSLLVALNSLL